MSKPDEKIMNETAKDRAQDQIILENARRITRNEEAIKRQTSALEQIRDHYYPPQASLTRRAAGFCVKVLCVVLAYAGGVQAVDWYVDTRQSKALAERCATLARRLFFRESNAAGAVRFCEKAIELDNGDATYRMVLAFMKGMAFSASLFDAGRPLTAAEQERTDEALAEAAFLQACEPDSPMPNVLMAQAYGLRGEKAEAVAAVDRAVACDPENASVRVSACALNFMAGQVAQARKQLAEAERLDASLPLVTLWKGMFALTVDRDAAAARGFFEQVTRTVPRLAMAHVMLGQALLAQAPDAAGVGPARKAFQRALQLDVRQKMALRGMAATYEREKNPIVARLWLDRALALDGNDLPALLARARIGGQTGAYAAAAADLSAAIALAPFRADLYRLRAEVREKAGEREAAKEDRATAAALERK